MKKFKDLVQEAKFGRTPGRRSWEYKHPKQSDGVPPFKSKWETANTSNSVSESMMSQGKQFMKGTVKDVKHSAEFHIRSKGKSLETNKVSANTAQKLEESKIKAGDSDQLKLLKLQNMALRAMPSSPKQKQLQAEIHALREKMKAKGQKEYHQTLKEGVTGPTRMQLQKHFDSQHGSLRARIYNTEKAHGVYDIRVNSQGDIIHFKETPHHYPTFHGVSHASGQSIDGPLHENFEDHTTNKFHKVLTKHGWVHHKTVHSSNITPTTEHIYTHPAHGKSTVGVLRFHKGGSDSWHHHHEQTNGIIGPYGSGETKPHLDRHLGRMYGGKNESNEYWIIKEAFEKAKNKKDKDVGKSDNKFPTKNKDFGSQGDDQNKKFPPPQGDSNAQPKDKNSDLKNDNKEGQIKLSGKKEKFNPDPKIEPISYMDGQGVTNV